MITLALKVENNQFRIKGSAGIHNSTTNLITEHLMLKQHYKGRKKKVERQRDLPIHGQTIYTLIFASPRFEEPVETLRTA